MLDTATAALEPLAQLKSLAQDIGCLTLLPRVEGDAVAVLRRSFRAWHLRQSSTDTAETQTAAEARMSAVLARSGRPSYHECAATVVAILVDRTLEPGERLADLERLCPGIGLASYAVRAPDFVATLRQIEKGLETVTHEYVDNRWTRIDLPDELEEQDDKALAWMRPFLGNWEALGAVQNCIRFVSQILPAHQRPEAFVGGHSSAVQEWALAHLYVEAALCQVLTETDGTVDEHQLRHALATLTAQM
jgi:hypothetical protein